jgi:hypothetical protein
MSRSDYSTLLELIEIVPSLTSGGDILSDGMLWKHANLSYPFLS